MIRLAPVRGKSDHLYNPSLEDSWRYQRYSRKRLVDNRPHSEGLDRRKIMTLTPLSSPVKLQQALPFPGRAREIHKWYFTRWPRHPTWTQGRPAPSLLQASKLACCVTTCDSAVLASRRQVSRVRNLSGLHCSLHADRGARTLAFGACLNLAITVNRGPSSPPEAYTDARRAASHVVPPSNRYI
jgi:hypothetical protein